MLGAILKQLVGRGDIPEYLRDAFQKGKREFGGRGLRLPDLVGMLKVTIASLPRVFICIDAADECLPKYLPGLLGSLRDILRELPRTRVFITGRPHVKQDVDRNFAKAVVIPISPNADDIKSYLEMRLDMDTEPDAMNEDLRVDITRAILEKISDMCVRVFSTPNLPNDIYLPMVSRRFLLVSLHIDAILGEVTIRQRRRKLEEMTQGNGLGDAYTGTLTRLKAQKGNKSILGLKVLMWVLYSERPLQAEELRHALGVEIGSVDQDLENVPTLRTILASSLGLVTVEASSSTVRLVHFTLQEHLLSDLALFNSPHSAIAEVCLTYLNFGCVRALSPTLRSAPATTPLLKYASCYWAQHTRRGMTENVKGLALRLLDGFEEHISAQLMLLDYKPVRGPPLYFSLEGGPRGFTGLHGAAFLGVTRIFAAVLGMKEWDVNARDSIGSVDFENHLQDIVRYYASDQPGYSGCDLGETICGRTPLLWAAECGHEDVVELLLTQQDINPDLADTNWTPLLLAAKRGHGGVAKMLLERENVDPNRADTLYGRTPLSWAAEYGDQGTVKMLLDRDNVNPDHVDTEYGRTPLSRAAEHGHKGVVKMLLDRDNVNPDHVDTKFGRTPLSWAAGCGHEGVVNMLLDRENVNPDHADTKYGRTPLSWAADYGHEEVVKILLDRDNVNPDHVDTKFGRTPLSWAAKRGHDGVVKILLDRYVNPDHADTKYGRTSLLWAAKRGHDGVVKMLLDRDNVDPDHADSQYGRTPLSWAAGRGHEGVVKMLLDRYVNPDHVDTLCGRTPLSWAAEGGHEGVVKMLLDRDNVNPDHADLGCDRTPLSWAAREGHEGIVKMLLEREGVDLNRADVTCHTPLSSAVLRGHKGVIKILSEAERLAQEHRVTGAKPHFLDEEISAPTLQGPGAKR